MAKSEIKSGADSDVLSDKGHVDVYEEECNMNLAEQLNLETARIPWTELQRFFASGNAVQVHSGLDLIETALLIHEDRADEVKSLMLNGQLDVVTDQQALAWYESNSEVWAVVIKPWVLVQQA